MLRFGLLAMVGWLGGTGATVQAAPSTALGIFEDQSDVGNVLHAGSAVFDSKAKSYTVAGSGEDMWVGKDEFHFVWKKISADDVTIAADIAILGDSGEGHRKGVVMIRQDLEQDSVYVDAARHGDGLTSLQFRETRGGVTREVESNVTGPRRLQLEKRGDRFYMRIAGPGKGLKFAGGSARVELKAPFYVGIGVCAHNKDAVLQAAFTKIRVDARTKHAREDYSTIQTVIATRAEAGDARVCFVTRGHAAKPGWSADGKSVTFSGGGKTQEVWFAPLKTAVPVGAPIAAGAGDHYTYFASEQGGRMQIWRKQGEGGAPEQLTSDEFNNTSPHVSPDGKRVVFLSYAGDLKDAPGQGDVALRIMTLAEKKISVLTTFVGGQETLGSEPWSPDGQRIAFVSYQTIH